MGKCLEVLREKFYLVEWLHLLITPHESRIRHIASTDDGKKKTRTSVKTMAGYILDNVMEWTELMLVDRGSENVCSWCCRLHSSDKHDALTCGL